MRSLGRHPAALRARRLVLSGHHAVCRLRCGLEGRALLASLAVGPVRIGRACSQMPVSSFSGCCHEGQKATCARSCPRVSEQQ